MVPWEHISKCIANRQKEVIEYTCTWWLEIKIGFYIIFYVGKILGLCMICDESKIRQILFLYVMFNATLFRLTIEISTDLKVYKTMHLLLQNIYLKIFYFYVNLILNKTA